jgi:rod shape-determining protein MreD
VRVFWTAVALLAALLLQTALTQIAPGHARILDPFLIVLVYCGLTGGEMYGILAGAAAGWIQDIHFGGSVLGLAGLTKILVGFAVGFASMRFHLVEAGPRAVVLFVATAADALIYTQLASVFDVASYEITPAGILGRALVNAVVGVAAYEILERRGRLGMGVRRRA